MFFTPSGPGGPIMGEAVRKEDAGGNGQNIPLAPGPRVRFRRGRLIEWSVFKPNKVFTKRFVQNRRKKTEFSLHWGHSFLPCSFCGIEIHKKISASMHPFPGPSVLGGRWVGFFCVDFLERNQI